MIGICRSPKKAVCRESGWQTPIPNINEGITYVAQNGMFLLLALLLAVGLKYHYSKAGSEDLAWILAPTTALVEQISGIPFAKETNIGFVNYTHRVVIAPACAGVNFLIVAFCMAVFSGLPQTRRGRLKWPWLVGAAAGAYGLTVLANAARIIASVYSYDADIHFGWLTLQRVHRLEGVVIYFFFLCLFYRIITAVYPLFGKAEKGNHASRGPARVSRLALAPLIPLFWYGLITLALPMLNGAASKDEARFVEHAAMIIFGCLGVVALVFLIESGWRRGGRGSRLRR